LAQSGKRAGGALAKVPGDGSGAPRSEAGEQEGFLRREQQSSRQPEPEKQTRTQTVTEKEKPTFVS
tara:strand:- start:17 stop:214 length:198 start_codon:yes stop_codon:yes gene_type:complete